MPQKKVIFDKEENQTSKTEKQKFSFSEAAVVITLATAFVYICDWLFEFFSCISLAIPIDFIRVSSEQLPLFALTMLIFTSIMFFADFFIRLYSNWIYMGFGAFFIALFNGIDYYLNKQFIDISIDLYIVAITVSLIVIRFILSKFWNKDFRKKMLYSIFTKDTDFSKPFGENFPPISKQVRYLVFIAFCLFIFSGFTGYIYPKVFPPTYRIKGNNQLVLLKKYGDLIICGETTTNCDTLTKTIKIIKPDTQLELTKSNPVILNQ